MRGRKRRPVGKSVLCRDIGAAEQARSRRRFSVLLPGPFFVLRATPGGVPEDPVAFLVRSHPEIRLAGHCATLHDRYSPVTIRALHEGAVPVALNGRAVLRQLPSFRAARPHRNESAENIFAAGTANQSQRWFQDISSSPLFPVRSLPAVLTRVIASVPPSFHCAKRDCEQHARGSFIIVDCQVVGPRRDRGVCPRPTIRRASGWSSNGDR